MTAAFVATWLPWAIWTGSLLWMTRQLYLCVRDIYRAKAKARVEVAEARARYAARTAEAQLMKQAVGRLITGQAAGELTVVMPHWMWDEHGHERVAEAWCRFAIERVETDLDRTVISLAAVGAWNTNVTAER